MNSKPNIFKLWLKTIFTPGRLKKDECPIPSKDVQDRFLGQLKKT